MATYAETGNTLRDYLRIILRYKLMIITILITGMISVYFKLQLIMPAYEANVKMLVVADKEMETDYYRGLHTRNLPEHHSQNLVSRRVIERVVNALRLYERPVDYQLNVAPRLKRILMERSLKTFKSRLEEMSPQERKDILFNKAVDDLTKSINVSPIEATNMFYIIVRDVNPSVAAAIANSLSRSYIIYDLEQLATELKLTYGEKHKKVAQIQMHIDELSKTLDGKILPDLDAMGPGTMKILEQAYTSDIVAGINKKGALVSTFFGSILFGIILAFTFDYLHQTFKSSQDVENFLKIPYLGSIPKSKFRRNKLLNVSSNSGNRNYIQAYQRISDQLYLTSKQKNIKSFLITNVEEPEHASIVIANLGIYLAHKTGHRVLIIDADLRSSSISRIFHVSDASAGLTDVIDENIFFEDAIQDLGSHLHFLSSGTGEVDSIKFIDSSKMMQIIEKARETYEIIFINSLSLKKYMDAIILSSIVDATVLLINEGKVKRQIVQQAIKPMEQKKSNIIGVILNNCDYNIPEIIYRFT